MSSLIDKTELWLLQNFNVTQSGEREEAASRGPGQGQVFYDQLGDSCPAVPISLTASSTTQQYHKTHKPRPRGPHTHAYVSSVSYSIVFNRRFVQHIF